MDPESQLLLVIDVGTRTLEMAQRVVHQAVQIWVPGGVPLFLTDGFKDYGTALLSHFGYWIQPERHQDKGPMLRPRWMPLLELLYAQVVKSYRRCRIGEANTGRLRHTASHRASLGAMWLTHQHICCGKA